jgi:RecB family exonuclease
MSTHFLHRFAQQLLEEFPDNLNEVTIVLPTHRSRLFLLKHLHALKGGAFWTPRFMILPEFVKSLSAGRVGGEVEMTLALFDLYKNKIAGDDDLSAFLGWSSIALRDFNDVDSAMANAKRLFTDLRNIREIENWDLEGWSFDKNPLSQSQELFLKFWLQLGELYQSFADWQDRERCWTYARMVRYLAENPQEMTSLTDHNTIFFVGLGSYSAAERALIKHVSEVVDVRMKWDLDHYYYSNVNHEAGNYAREYGWRIIRDEIKEHIAYRPLDVKIYRSGTSVSQLMRAADVLRTMPTEQLENTCVVINDESSLEPLLSTLTDIDVSVNLAIGKPLQQTQLSRITEQVFAMRSTEAKKGTFYFKPFNLLVRLIRALRIDDFGCDRILDEVVKQHLVRISQDDLKDWRTRYQGVGGFLALFEASVKPIDALQLLRDLFAAISSESDFLLVTQQKMLALLDELIELVERYPLINDDDLLLQVYQMVIARTKIFYRGEPVDGLQLLSLSETRALDFDTVLFLDANEEFMPGQRFEQSFIPFDLRAFYKLTMPADTEGIHAYSYYRLLQEARELHYFFSTITSEKKGTEESRYITQLRDELCRVNRSIVVHDEIIGTVDLVSGAAHVDNTPFIQERMRAIMEGGLSPSAINKLISCPLDFYYRYIAKLGEEDEVEEHMTNSTFGRLIHKVLERFYEPHKEKFPSTQEFEAFRKDIDSELRIALTETYSPRNVAQGVNYLAMQIAKEMLTRYVQRELEVLEEETSSGVSRKIVWLEKEANGEIANSESVLGFPIKVKGIIDRADEVDGRIHVIDYKTGKVSSNDKKFKGSVAQIFEKSEYGKILQLLTYVMMVRDKGKALPNALFYSFREKGGEFVQLSDLVEAEINHDYINSFEEAFVQWASSMMQLTRFEHNKNSKYCQYCLNKKDDSSF